MTDTRDYQYSEEIEPEGLSEIADLIGSLPRIKPGRAFRVRMALYTRAPSLACRHVEGMRSAVPEQRGGKAGKRPVHGFSPLRVAAAAALVVLIAFGVFGALAFAARHSQPGNPLYSVKRFRENLELLLTFDTAKKAQKNLSLAQTRLSELDYLIEEKKLDPVSLVAVAGDYTSRRDAVEDILRRDGALADAKVVASQLRVIDTTEENIEKRLEGAGANAALSPASHARVTVTDPGGGSTLDNGKSTVRTKTDGGGQVSFSADIDGEGGARDLEVFIELDGRSQVMPLYGADFGSARGTLTTSVSPRVSTIEIGRPQLYALTVTDKDGADLAGKTVRLGDRTGTSSINGIAGEVSLTTDRDGTCAFTVTKNSLDHVSRINASLIDGTAYDLGEVLTVGGLRTVADEHAPGAVKARSLGPPAGPQNIELDNGLIRVTAGGGRRGYIVEGITGVAEPGKAGPLYDQLAADGSGTPGAKVSGPRLTFSNAGAAGYMVDLEAPDGLRKTYQVVLAKGKPYVTITCLVESSPEPAATPGSGDYVEVSRLAIDQGAEIEVSGKKVPRNPSDNPIELMFQVGRPYAVVESGGCPSILAFPINSETCPTVWSLSRSYIAPAVLYPQAGSKESAGFTFILGTGSDRTIDSLKTQSLSGIEVVRGEEASQAAADGFAVEVNPSIDQLRKGEQTLLLSLYRRYRKVLDR